MGVEHPHSTMDLEAQLEQFVSLRDKIQTVQLPDHLYSISWALIVDGHYSTHSAYEFQFLERVSQPDFDRVWKLKVEGRVQYFIKLLLHNCNCMADRLSSRGCPHNDTCCLCDEERGTLLHLALKCSYAKEVWQQFRGSMPFICPIATSSAMIRSW